MQQRPPRALGFRMPAEWEPHSATWLAWPHHRTDFLGKLSSARHTLAEVARLLSTAERVRLIVKDGREQAQAARGLARAGVDLKQVDFFGAGTDRSWTRDYLPSFVVRGRGRTREVGAVKWRFNGWARYPAHKRDQQAGLNVAAHVCRRVWLPRGRVKRFVLEGGAFDVDGQGTVLVERGCLLEGQRARNPELSVAETEQVLCDYLGVERVLWVEGGVAGDDTSGHVDDFVRFAAPGKILLARERNRRDVNYGPLRRAYESLRNARDARGRRLEVIELPMPQPVLYSGWRLPASYANFYVANGLVIVPTFNDPHDKAALGILSELFPGRTVVGVYARDFVLGQGTIHCTTQQEPRGTKPAAYQQQKLDFSDISKPQPPGLSQIT